MFKSFMKLFVGNFIGKVIGLLREIIIAYFYGISIPVSTFRVAQSATLIPINFFTSDALNAGFIPLYNHYKKLSFRKAQSLFWLLVFVFFVLSIFISFILFFYASYGVTLISPGFDEKAHILATNFIKIMSIGVPFYVLSSLFSYLAISNNFYFLASIRPTIQSIGIIIGVVFAYFFDNILLFAWGFTGAYILFFLIGLFFLKNQKLLKFYFLSIKEIIRDFWNNIKPLLLLPLILQGNIVIEKIVASLIGANVIAAVEYAKFITETGVVLLAVPLGLVGLSSLSNLTIEEMKNKLTNIIPIILIITIPISLFLFIYSDLIISLIFKRGAFTQNSVFVTKSILIGLSFSFWAQILSYVMVKFLNAQRKNRDVAILMTFSLISNAIFNLIFYKLLGPITIGLGASVYNIILVILTINKLKMLKDFFKVLFLLFVGSIICYLVINQIFILNSFKEIMFSILFFILYWISYINSIPLLRNFLNILLKKFKGL